MEELEELKARLSGDRPAEWDALPDINLYMDQLISYMPRQLIHYGEGELLTSAMVNNYIKDGLLPRAEGKRYNQSHLAYLTAICVLKQVLCVRETKLLIAAGTEHRPEETRQLYEYFRGELDEALSDTAQGLDAGSTPEDLPHLALHLALRSYADRLACQRVLDILARHRPEPEKTERKKEKAPRERD